MVISNQLRCQNFLIPSQCVLKRRWRGKNKILLILTLITVTHVYPYKIFAICFFLLPYHHYSVYKTAFNYFMNNQLSTQCIFNFKGDYPRKFIQTTFYTKKWEEGEKVSYHNGQVITPQQFSKKCETKHFSFPLSFILSLHHKTNGIIIVNHSMEMIYYFV